MASHAPLGSGRARPARRRIVVLLAVLLACLGAGCGNGQSSRSAAPTSSSSVATHQDPRPQAAPVDVTIVDPPETLAARSDHDVALFAVPGAEAPSDVAMARNSFGSPLVMLVTRLGAGQWAGWYEVLVPGRPNGRTAWVRKDDVALNKVEHEVEVDLASRTLVVRQGGQQILSTPVAIGDVSSPTPTGRFSLTDKLDTGRPDGPYGPFALGLSARSDALTEFAGGDAQVGIHGTNDPSSIGRAASHGCIRVPNAVIVQLSEMLALGTPVTVR